MSGPIVPGARTSWLDTCWYELSSHIWINTDALGSVDELNQDAEVGTVAGC